MWFPRLWRTDFQHEAISSEVAFFNAPAAGREGQRA
nr:MAG TPA: hypothetical protein [Caudoviricetes sp.]